MTENQGCGEVQFEADFTSATDHDGNQIAFTRLESRALTVMTQRPGQVLSRNQLLDALSASGSDKNDRNIDFLINRIRRKLGDNPKDPKFIATRYGEGYVWLVKTSPSAQSAPDAKVVIGPLKGLERLNGSRANGRLFGDRLARQLGRHLQEGEKVVVLPDHEAVGPGRSDSLEIEVGLTFFQDHTGTECVVTAKSTQANRVFYVERIAIVDGSDVEQSLNSHAERMGPLLLARYWETKATTATSDIPLPVAMHEATDPDNRSDLTWTENDKRLRTLRAEHPDDPSIKLLYATHLHTNYVSRGREIFLNEEVDCARDEREIETLVLEALDYAQTIPERAIMAAKLLYFVDRGYAELALDLAQTAHRSTTSIASSLSMYGQLLGFVGDTDAAVEQLEQALHLTEEKSHFRLYVLVMLCQALMAAGRREELAEARSRLCSTHLASIFFEPLFADPINPSLKARGVAMMVSRKKAVAILKHLHYVSARLYLDQEHRENSLRTPVNLFVRRFGRQIVPNYILKDAPGLL